MKLSHFILMALSIRNIEYKNKSRKQAEINPYLRQNPSAFPAWGQGRGIGVWEIRSAVSLHDVLSVHEPMSTAYYIFVLMPNHFIFIKFLASYLCHFKQLLCF